MEWRTVEVRWFRPGPCPAAVQDWFHSGARVSPPEDRVDRYAPLQRDDLGIKTRGVGLLDVKARTGVLTADELPSGLEGRVEAWTKWSFALDPRRVEFPNWLSVGKVRWTRRYEVVESGVRPIAMNELVPAGCAAELAVVEAAGTEAWSFGFEAFGEAGEAALAAGARGLLSETPLEGLRFEAEDSFSYPSWLSRVTSSDER